MRSAGMSRCAVSTLTATLLLFSYSAVYADVELGGSKEPAIAINPLDSNNIAVADLYQIRVSTDGGTTFTAPTDALVPAGYIPVGDPSLAFDSQGRLFWTYLGRLTSTFTNDIFIAQVDPGTGAVSAGYPKNVTAGAGMPAATIPGQTDKPWLAAGRYLG